MDWARVVHGGVLEFALLYNDQHSSGRYMQWPNLPMPILEPHSDCGSYAQHGSFKLLFITQKRKFLNWPLTAVFFKLVQCQPLLNHEIQQFVVEGVRFTHTKPIPKGFGLSVFLKVIHTPKTPQKRVFSSNPKINFPHSDLHKITIGTCHKPNKHPHVKD